MKFLLTLTTMMTSFTTTSASDLGDSPFALKSALQYEAPDFSRIRDEHFMPAFELGMKQQTEAVLAIIENPAPPTVENTLEALEKSRPLLSRVSSVFRNLSISDSNATRRRLALDLASKLAAHSDNIYLNSKLFARVSAIYEQRAEGALEPEAIRLTEVIYERFVQAGALLTDDQKTTIRALNEEHSTLTNQFAQNLLAETERIAVIVETEEELDGLSESKIATTAQAATEAGHDGKYLLAITNTTRQPMLAQLHNRALRERIWRASSSRASSGEFDNTAIILRLAKIRAKRASLFGHHSYAAYSLQYEMAKTPKAVFDLLGSMVPAVVKNTQDEQKAIQEMIHLKGGDFEMEPWDWEYYAEFVRQETYDFSESEVKEYFEFERVLKDGLFHCFERFYGIRFQPRPDLPVYHSDVRAYEVINEDGTSIAIFYADYFAREGKRGGAWMSSFVDQSRLLDQKPVVVNVMNIAKAPEGQPTLLSYDHVITMFHELGHGVHGIFSDVNYPSLSGTAVSRDFVEFPSTFEEDWAEHPEIIANYARHYKTGEAIPADLLAKVLRSGGFNQGFDTLEYLAAALLDMEWHSLPHGVAVEDVDAFETATLQKHGVHLPAVPSRYRSRYFSHSMGGGYSAGYYAYLWSEILAADCFAYVQKNGGLSRKLGDRYRKEILSRGNSRLPMDSYKAFRGQEPTTDALLIRRGLKPRR